jgi:hypothetical protein
LIRVEPADEPKHFDKLVRQPGLSAIVGADRNLTHL